MKLGAFKKRKTPYGAISVSPVPSPEELANFYAEIYYQENSAQSYAYDYSEEEIAQRRLRAELMLYALEKISPPVKKGEPFLEIGCGEGFILQAAAEKGYTIHGVDFSEFGIRKLHPELTDKVEFGDAYEILQRHLAADKHFKICVMQNVLEHIIDPPLLLQKVKNILLPGGIVSVTVPNDYSQLQQKAKETKMVDEEYWFLPSQHLHYFNAENIRDFAAYCGYEVVDSYADFPIDIFLFHPGSNYVKNKSNGKAAHQARLTLDLLLGEQGMGAYHRFYQALADCGMGRNVTVLLKPLA